MTSSGSHSRRPCLLVECPQAVCQLTLPSTHAWGQFKAGKVQNHLPEGSDPACIPKTAQSAAVHTASTEAQGLLLCNSPHGHATHSGYPPAHEVALTGANAAKGTVSISFKWFWYGYMYMCMVVRAFNIM